jgi:Pvc16 N-terminal domain
MPVPVSSLSVAVQGIADFLDSQFGEEVTITVAHPQRASEIAKGAGVSAHCLNIFAYRVSPSGFYADAGSDDTQFLRIQALLTPFPADDDDADDDADIRILGHAIRVLQCHPILPITTAPLPGTAITEPAGRKKYRLQSVMLAPAMEEINHIWTTQGSDIAYRLSVVYEFALVPIEPLDPRVVADPPETMIIGTNANMEGAIADFIVPNDNSRAFPVRRKPPPPTNWLPVQLLVEDGGLTNRTDIASVTTAITCAVAGPPGEPVAFEIAWSTPGGAVEQPAQIFPIAAAMIDAEEARHLLTLDVPAGATEGQIRVRPARNGKPLKSSPFGNVLTLTVT